MIVLFVAGVLAWSLVCVAFGCWLGRAASRKERGGYINPNAVLGELYDPSGERVRLARSMDA